MSDYIVLQRVQCKECSGTGWIEHRAWKRYNPDDYFEPGAYFRAIGYDDIPPEEVECDMCGGNGYITLEKDAEEVFKKFCRIYQLPLEEPE